METAATIIVALAVGAFGGLLGSIAGPMLSHRLDRGRRKELREEERHRDIRSMLEGMMRLARAQATGISVMMWPEFAGMNLQQAWNRHFDYLRDLEKRYPFFLWQPYRIKDQQLQDLARQLQEVNSALTLLI